MKEINLMELIIISSEPPSGYQACNGYGCSGGGWGCGDQCNGSICGGFCLGSICGYSTCHPEPAPEER